MNNSAEIGGAGASVIDQAAHTFGLFGIAPQITTVISLAAVAIIAAYLIARQWLVGRHALADKAIGTNDDAALSVLLNGVSVGDLSGLSTTQKFDLTAQQLRQRFWTDCLKVAAVLAAFLALLGFIVLLVIKPKVEPVPNTAPGSSPASGASPRPSAAATTPSFDPIKLTKLLITFPKTSRAAMCELVEPKAVCDGIVAGIADIPQVTLDGAQQTEVAASLRSRTLPPGLVQSVSSNPGVGDIVSLAKPKGWNVDVFWCRGGDEQDRLARATAAANALKGRSADGVTIGRIRIRALEAGRQGNGLPSAGDGAFVRVDDMPGKAQAVKVVRTLLANALGQQYTLSTTMSRIPQYISLFECR